MKYINTKKHDKEHQNWSRRQFLMTGGMASLGGLLLSNTPVNALNPSNMMTALNGADSDRILILIYLAGGNDGLNTIIPYSVDVGRDTYFNYRPILKQMHGVHYDDNHLLSNYGDTNFALNSNMEPLMDMWHDGDMRVIHKVGYENQNLSHFISQKLWFSGTNAQTDPNYTSGWLGRNLEQLYPHYLDVTPTVPLALNVGPGAPDNFLNSEGFGMHLPISDPNQFVNEAQRGQYYATDGFGTCAQDEQRLYLRRVANNSLNYAETIYEAYNASANMPTVNYSYSKLSESMKVIARLIKGGLSTKLYMVSIDRFDTHHSQLQYHSKQLGHLSDAIKEFHQDLAATGDDERVVSFTFSEFGRTIRGNGNGGTDHGSLSDLMLFGKGVNGGFSGTPIDLNGEDIHNSGGVRTCFDQQEGCIDYRRVYATLLQDWLCIDGNLVDYALGQHFSRLDNLITDPCTANQAEHAEVLLGHRTSIENTAVTEIRYGVLQPGRVKIDILNSVGQNLVTLVDEHHTTGTHIFEINAQTYPFSAGQYFYKMYTGGKEYMRKLEF